MFQKKIFFKIKKQIQWHHHFEEKETDVIR